MKNSKQAVDLAADGVLFNLEDLYQGVKDPQIMQDLDRLAEMTVQFQTRFKGKLKTSLEEALLSMQEIDRLGDKVFVFVYLKQACDSANQTIQQVMGVIRSRFSSVVAENMIFFDQEIGKDLRESDYQHLLQISEIVAKHKSYLDHIRKKATYLLSPEVERALELRAPFGDGEWKEFFKEAETLVRFSTDDGSDSAEKELTLAKFLTLLITEPSQEKRRTIMRVLNSGLKMHLAPIMTRALNVIAGRKGVSDEERGYAHPMAAASISNRVSDTVVEGLHQAVCSEGVQQCRRYYRLLAEHLGVDKLYWSDRLATPFPEQSEKIPWPEGLEMVLSAYQSFSPTLSSAVSAVVDNGWIDVPAYEGKNPGAFCMSACLPAALGPRAYVSLNYQGTPRHVMTTAHELGHAAHGILAGEAQGPLMSSAPIAYAETASIFGESIVFSALLERADTREKKLSLLMQKSLDFIGSVVRQISFSMFEQRVHAARKRQKLTTAEFCEHWKEVTRQTYGEDGDPFDYSDMEYLWSYVPHFMTPFYVYSYAFGELLTQSLLAVKDDFGTDFEALYLEVLRAGSTKNATELLAPFGLNPEDPEFWVKGIRVSIGQWLDQVESLSG